MRLLSQYIGVLLETPEGVRLFGATIIDPRIFPNSPRNSLTTSQRGWILQERLLSLRIVTFGHQQLWWECYGSHICETFPKGLPQRLPSSIEGPPFSIREMKVPEYILVREGLEEWKQYKQSYTRAEVERWYDVLHDYPDRSFTKLEDKLPAIAAIASAVAK